MTDVQSTKTVKAANTVISRVTKGMEKSISDAEKMMSDLKGLASIAASVAEEIEIKTGELVQLEADTAIKVREQAIQFNLAVQENKDQVLFDLLKEKEYATISVSELNLLKNKLVALESDNSEAIAEAVSTATAILNREHVAIKSELTSTHNVQVAEYKADIRSLTHQVEQMSNTITNLQHTIDQERLARVEISKSQSQPTINVGNTGK